MKMWSINVMILLLLCYACLSTGNGNVRFVSRNFFNVLHWDPAEPAFPGQRMLYSVKYKSDNNEEPYQIKEECQNITDLSCDLTAETPSLYDVYYHAKVLVNGSRHGFTIKRFNPSEDTTLGPPTLTISTNESSLFVNVTLPLGPNGISIADIIINSKRVPSETTFFYRLNFNHSEKVVSKQNFENQIGQFHFDLKTKSRYCGSVSYRPSSDWGRPWSEDASFCVTLSESPWIISQWLPVSAAVVAALVIITVVSMCKYVKGGKPKSIIKSLEISPGTPKVLHDLDRNRILSVVYPENDKIVYSKIQMNPNAPSVWSGGYSPQNIPCTALQDSTGSFLETTTHTIYPNPEDTSSQSSDIYGAVAVHVPPAKNEGFQQAVTEHREISHQLFPGERSPTLTSREAPLLPNLYSCDSSSAGKLQLHTERDINGKLRLPLLQLQNSTADTVSPVNPERKLLLTDLTDSEWSDSGCDESTSNTPTHPYCNTHYSPSQPVVSDFDKGCQNSLSSDTTFKSGYKQNWMPESLHGLSTTDSCRMTNYSWTCTGSKKEDGR